MTTSYDLGALKQPDEVGAGRDPRDIILPQPGFKTVLANRDFRLIWSAQVASQLVDKFLMFALLILTYSISRASTHGAALFLAYTFPRVFPSAYPHRIPPTAPPPPSPCWRPGSSPPSGRTCMPAPTKPWLRRPTSSTSCARASPTLSRAH